MMAFPRGLMRLDFGFILIFGFEDRFFFFWSSRPMMAVSDEGGVLGLCEWIEDIYTSCAHRLVNFLLLFSRFFFRLELR